MSDSSQFDTQHPTFSPLVDTNLSWIATTTTRSDLSINQRDFNQTKEVGEEGNQQKIEFEKKKK